MIEQIKTGISREPMNTRRVTKDGRILDVCLTATKLVDDEGNYNRRFQEQLKNASIFNLSKKNAKFVYSDLYYDYLADQEKTVNNYLVVDIKWNSKTQLTIKVTCLTSPYDIEFPLIADYYIGDIESRSIADDQELVDASISI